MRDCPVVLFLDFDGVLHPVGGTQDTSREGGRSRQRMARLPMLEALLREPALQRVGVVISSTWRVVYNLAQLRCQFAPDLRERIIGLTPQLEHFSTRHARHEEICTWLAANPQVTAWVAIDDDLRGFPPSSLPNLVPTNSDTGLNPRDIEVLRERLLAALQAAPPASGKD
jgi:hypothetical protein